MIAGRHAFLLMANSEKKIQIGGEILSFEHKEASSEEALLRFRYGGLKLTRFRKVLLPRSSFLPRSIFLQ